MSDVRPLLEGFRMGDLTLPNRVIMASLTRGRANNAELAPTQLHAIYYAQRASAGLILTESTWVSRNAIGFIKLPGIFTKVQVEGWKAVTDAVHNNNGRIFLQMAHSGSVSHPGFHVGELAMGGSAINPMGKSYTLEGFKDIRNPLAYRISDIRATITEYKIAAENANEAGFDGIELHAHLFTLIPQFLSGLTNERTDQYGGNIENRSRLLFEILDAVTEVFKSNRVGIKFSPAAFKPGSIKPGKETRADYEFILHKLNDYNLAYVQIVGPAGSLKDTALDNLQDNYFSHFRKMYNGTLMANLGFTYRTGNEIIEDGNADLVSFGSLFIANPDLVSRFSENVALAEADSTTYYTGGQKGYVDYPRSTLYFKTKTAPIQKI